MSVFAVVTRGSKVLIGTPRPHRAWKTKWLFSWAFYSDKELHEAYKERRLPSSYLLEGEDPKQGLRRVMTEQLGVADFAASGPRVLSYVEPSSWYPGHKHWDLAFVYTVRFEGPLRRLPWWSDLEFVDRRVIDASRFGWNSDFVRDIGVARAVTR